MATQEQRKAKTRKKLLHAFRDSFLEHGFEATTTQSTLKQIGLSKGALYHHFQSKTEIMEAIYENESRTTIERVLAETESCSSFAERLRETCVAWIRAVESNETARILFEIGPAALGQRRAKAIEDQYSLYHFEHLLDQAKAAGEIEIADPKLIATMLNALVSEALLHKLRTGKDPIDELVRAIDSILQSYQPKSGI